MDGSRTNILVENDILLLDDFVINIKNKSALIRSCGVMISVNAKQCRHFFSRKLLASKEKTIPPCLDSMIPFVLVFSSNNRDFLFHLTIQANLTLYTYIFDHKTSKILFKNTIDCLLRILRHQRHCHIIDIAYNNCFLVDT